MKQPSGGRLWEGEYPPSHGKNFLNIEYQNLHFAALNKVFFEDFILKMNWTGIELNIVISCMTVTQLEHHSHWRRKPKI